MLTFEEKVRSMTAKEIIMAMVEGLENPVTKMDMSTFGYVLKGVCYGCAATNTICKIAGFDEEKTAKTLKSLLTGFRNSYLGDYEFVQSFEFAIDLLRLANIEQCNHYLKNIRLPQIVNPKGIVLPALYDYYTHTQLNEYRKLANSQPC